MAAGVDDRGRDDVAAPERTLTAAVVWAAGDRYPRTTFVPVIGLFVSFSRSVTAKAAAVAASRPTMTAVERIRCKAASVYACDRGDPRDVPRPHGEPGGAAKSTKTPVATSQPFPFGATSFAPEANRTQQSRRRSDAVGDLDR